MKDIVITLPERIWYCICSGGKKIELRKRIPEEFDINFSKVWVIRKGSSQIMGYFNIESFREDQEYMKRIVDIAIAAVVSVEFVRSYYQGYKKACIWNIGPVYKSDMLYDRYAMFGMKHNPQSFVYVDGPMHNLYVHRVQ